MRQQLKSSRRELKKSHKMNKQLLRQIGKLQEQIQAMTKLQELMAERQLKELNDDRPSSRRHDNMDAAVGPADDAKHSMLCVFMICCVSLTVELLKLLYNLYGWPLEAEMHRSKNPSQWTHYPVVFSLHTRRNSYLSASEHNFWER